MKSATHTQKQTVEHRVREDKRFIAVGIVSLVMSALTLVGSIALGVFHP